MEGSEGTAVEKLKSEKEELEKKCEKLARIIEISANAMEEKKPRPGPEGGTEAGKGLEELKKNIASIEKKFKKISEVPDSSKEIGSIKSSLAGIEERMKLLEKIPEIESRIENVEKGGGEVQQKPAGGSIFGGFGSVDSELYKTGIKDLTNSVGAIKAAFEEFKTETVQRMDETEKKVSSVWAKLDPQTIKILETFSSSRGEIINEVIPRHVHDEVERILSVFSHEMADISEGMKELSRKVENMNNKVLYFLNNIQQLKGRIDEIERRLGHFEQGRRQDRR